MPDAVASVFLVAVVVGFVWFSIWTWRRLWRPPITDPYSVLVYRFGVRGFGLFMLAAMTFTPPLSDANNPLRLTLASPDFWSQTLFSAIIGAPMSLWAGYWWGRGMAWFFGVRPAASLLDRDRPQN